MATYTRSTRVDAPLEEVWAFHTTPDGLEALTPDFMNLDVRDVTGPDGESDTEELPAGSRVRLAVRPFGVGPEQSWTTVITERTEDERRAHIRDVMEDGPFPIWEHTHRFVGDGDTTVITDHVEYHLPGGPLGRWLSPLGWPGFEAVFRVRHRRTKSLLE